MSASLLLAAVALAAAALTFVSGRFFARRSWLADLPVDRSSHRRATPRTGGVAVALGFMAPALALLPVEPALARFLPLYGAAFALGLVDDARPLPALVKLAGQVAIACVFVFLFGAVELVPAPFIGELALGPLAPALTVFWIVAFMNAFNFMDGANGLAATAAIFGLSMMAVAAAATGAGLAGGAAVLLAAAVFGFLPLNFPRARLFLGDSGSQAVGFAIAAIAVIAARTGGGAAALVAPTVFMPFLFDVAFTLAHRAIRRRNILEAHNEHLYQLMIRLGARHASVTALYVLLVALSALAAIFANALSPALQALAPAGLAALFTAPALLVYRRASAAGLLASAAKKDLRAAQPAAKPAE